MLKTITKQINIHPQTPNLDQGKYLIDKNSAIR